MVLYRLVHRKACYISEQVGLQNIFLPAGRWYSLIELYFSKLLAFFSKIRLKSDLRSSLNQISRISSAINRQFPQFFYKFREKLTEEVYSVQDYSATQVPWISILTQVPSRWQILTSIIRCDTILWSHDVLWWPTSEAYNAAAEASLLW